jgi:4-hydroxy-tetrahydrodipicolinate reductase
MPPLKIVISGAAGRMGAALVRAASADARFTLAGAVEREGAADIGRTIGGVTVTADLGRALAHADAFIDFTTPAATVAALPALARANVRTIIIGTTGLDAAQEAAVAAAARERAIVKSGNFSLGVTLLAALVEEAARRLDQSWDIEIAELHHRRKVDAPSGTALLLGEAAARGRNVRLADVRAPARDSATPGARKPGEIGFAALRGGGHVGRHEVMFAAEREMLTLSHEALDRSVFADGALAAALWAAGKPPGLYSVRDVLGL